MLYCLHFYGLTVLFSHFKLNTVFYYVCFMYRYYFALYICCYCLRETLIKFIICKVSLPHKLSLFDLLLMLDLALFSCNRFCRKKKEQPKKEKPDIDQPQTKSRSTAPPE